MKQRRYFPFLRESIKVEDVDAVEMEEKVHDRYGFEIRKKESEEELEAE